MDKNSLANAKKYYCIVKRLENKLSSIVSKIKGIFIYPLVIQKIFQTTPAYTAFSKAFMTIFAAG